MQTILVTGCTGFIAKHIFEFYASDPNFRIVGVARDDYYHQEQLVEKLDKCDSLFHLAGVSRGGSDRGVYEENMAIHEYLIDVLDRLNKGVDIVFWSSIHYKFDTGYGMAKRDASALFRKYALERDVRFINVITPNIFGPYARVNYTSVVANFCDALFSNRLPVINAGSEVTLLYVKELLSCVNDSLHGRGEEVAPKGRVIKVEALYYLMVRLVFAYEHKRSIDYNENFQFYLLVTYLAYRLERSDITSFELNNHAMVDLSEFESVDGNMFYAEENVITRIFVQNDDFLEFEILNNFVSYGQKFSSEAGSCLLIDMPPHYCLEFKTTVNVKISLLSPNLC